MVVVVVVVAAAVRAEPEDAPSPTNRQQFQLLDRVRLVAHGNLELHRPALFLA